MAKKTILPLTSVRFFAALYVVVFHTLTELVRGVDNPDAINGGLLGLGYISVSFFFVLSGFILALVYFDDQEEIDKSRFWRARFARVYPLFLFTLLLDTPHSLLATIKHVGAHAGVVATAKILVVNIFMLQGWFVNFRGIDNPNWSLSVEAFFYLVFPFLGMALVKLKPKSLLVVMTISYVGGLGLVALANHAGLRHDAIKFSPLLHLHEFVEGVCVGLVVLRLGGKWKSILERWSSWALVGSAIAFVLFVAGSYRMLGLHLFIHDGLLAPLFLVVIVSLTFGSSVIHRVLAHRWLVVLGEASYGLYLIHIPVWHLVKPLPHGHSLSTYPIFLLSAIGLSVLSFYTLEARTRRFILSGKRSKETLVTSSMA